MNEVFFRFGTQQEYENSLQSDDSLYFVEDTQKLYKGKIDITSAITLVDSWDSIEFPVSGKFYYNTVSFEVKVYINDAWVTITYSDLKSYIDTAISKVAEDIQTLTEYIKDELLDIDDEFVEVNNNLVSIENEINSLKDSAVGEKTEGGGEIFNTYETFDSDHDPSQTITEPKNIASGDKSTAMGAGTQSTGFTSFAQGELTRALQNTAVALNHRTTATGYNSLAAGQDTLAQGHMSVAMGKSTVAQGEMSVADGESSIAIANNSHAGGVSSIAGSYNFNFSNPNAENKTLVLDGDLSQLEVGDVFSIYAYSFSGNSTIASNLDFYGTITAINGNTITIDNWPERIAEPWNIYSKLSSVDTGIIWFPEKPRVGQHRQGQGAQSEGFQNKAVAIGSHAEGGDNISGGKYSHTENLRNIAGYAAHAEGVDTQAIGYASHTQNEDTIAKGNGSTAMGRNTQAIGNWSLSTGDATVAAGVNSISAGLNTEATRPNQIVVGKNNGKYSNDSLFVIGDGVGGENNDIVFSWDVYNINDYTVVFLIHFQDGWISFPNAIHTFTIPAHEKRRYSLNLKTDGNGNVIGADGSVITDIINISLRFEFATTSIKTAGTQVILVPLNKNAETIYFSPRTAAKAPNNSTPGQAFYTDYIGALPDAYSSELITHTRTGLLVSITEDFTASNSYPYWRVAPGRIIQNMTKNNKSNAVEVTDKNIFFKSIPRVALDDVTNGYTVDNTFELLTTDSWKNAFKDNFTYEGNDALIGVKLTDAIGAETAYITHRDISFSTLAFPYKLTLNTNYFRHVDVEGIQTIKNWKDLITNTNYPSGANAGVIKIRSAYGISLGRYDNNSPNTGDTLVINKATPAEIDARTNSWLPIVPSNLDYAVQSALKRFVPMHHYDEKTNFTFREDSLTEIYMESDTGSGEAIRLFGAAVVLDGGGPDHGVTSRLSPSGLHITPPTALYGDDSFESVIGLCYSVPNESGGGNVNTTKLDIKTNTVTLTDPAGLAISKTWQSILNSKGVNELININIDDSTASIELENNGSSTKIDYNSIVTHSAGNVSIFTTTDTQRLNDADIALYSPLNKSNSNYDPTIFVGNGQRTELHKNALYMYDDSNNQVTKFDAIGITFRDADSVQKTIEWTELYTLLHPNG